MSNFEKLLTGGVQSSERGSSPSPVGPAGGVLRAVGRRTGPVVGRQDEPVGSGGSGGGARRWWRVGGRSPGAQALRRARRG